MSELQAWIIVADRSNMGRCAEFGVFGLNSGSQLPKMNVGDKIVAYIRKEVTFSGIGEVTKPYYVDNKSLFDGGLFPNRVGIKLRLLPEEDAINVWKLVDDLEFSKGKLHWQGALAGGMRKIPMTDFKKIESELMIKAR